MNVYPKKYTKEEFLKFLEKNNINEIIINNFLKLPKSVECSGNLFKLDIESTWYDTDDTFYNFDINYYSEELIEYLFNSKVFNDIEITINRIQCELIANKHIKIIN